MVYSCLVTGLLAVYYYATTFADTVQLVYQYDGILIIRDVIYIHHVNGMCKNCGLLPDYW